MFDRDEHPHFDAAVELCKAHHIGVGRSNPCFELWLILHERDYDRYDHRHAAQAQLKALHPEIRNRRFKDTELQRPGNASGRG